MLVKILKRILCTFVALVLLSLAWYGLQRLLAGNRQVQVTSISVEATAASQSESLKVGAYNIAHGRGGRLGESNWTSHLREKEEEHLSKIAAQIAEAGLDIVVLNEVDFDANWSNNRNQAHFIAENAGFPHVAMLHNIDIVLPFFKLQFGNAILSKLPLKDVQVIELPPVKEWEVPLAGKKNALEATVDFHGRQISIVAIHIETRDQTVRMESVQILLDRINQTNKPYLLLGDFNSQRGQQGTSTTAVETLITTGGFTTDAVTESWKTFPSESPRGGIDWIMVSAPLTTSNSRIINSPLSDHLMVTSEVSFTDESMASELTSSLLLDKKTEVLEVDPVAGKNPGATCFVAGTLVDTPNGKVAIEEISMGDSVYGYDHSSSSVIEVAVVDLFSRQVDQYYLLETEDEVLQVTSEHPFWVIGEGYKAVADLKPMDKLLLRNTASVEIVSVTFQEEYVTVYNLTVDSTHNYFVGDASILVHNKN